MNKSLTYRVSMLLYEWERGECFSMGALNDQKTLPILSGKSQLILPEAGFCF